MKKFIIFLSLLFLLTSCATQYQDATIYDPYGFFSGLLHGFVWFPALIISFFSDITVIGMPNTGGGYFIGFVIGVIFSFGVFNG